jgi:PTS system galactitol-specific IIA component
MNREDIFVMDVDVDSWQRAIQISGKKLFEEGYVKSIFSDECIKREKIYPTGLPTSTPIAIPHCGSQFVKKEGMCVLRLKKNVKFHRMDNVNQYIDTQIVFNLALKKDEEHIVFLQKFIGALSDEKNDFVQDCLNENIDKVPELFKKYNIL